MNRESFAEWALAPGRTLEERFGAEYLIEQVCGLSIPKTGDWNTDYQAQLQFRRERMLNPAYEPQYTAERAWQTEEKLPELKQIDSTHDDRILRDLSWLQFCPALERLNLPNTEVHDWSPLVELPLLRVLWIKEKLGWDFRPLNRLRQLTTVYFYFHAPWPDLSGLNDLPALEEIHFHGNPLAWTSVKRLPAVRRAEIEHWDHFKVPLRSLHDLPEMPELRTLKLINTWRLDGIERSPHLLNAELYGYFEDLTPLGPLRELTHLVISGGTYGTLAPLGSLPELRWLLVRREDPQDYSALAELPRLHEVEVELCPASAVEIAALNAALPPWSETFAVEPPRPLAPLRLLLDRKDDEPADDGPREKRDWRDNKGMETSEARWFARETNRRLNSVLGRGWGKCDTRYCRHAGSIHVAISRAEDIDQLRDIVEALRGLIASARHPWRCAVNVDSLARYERDLEDLEDEDDEEKEFDAERERQEWEYRQKRIRERREYLERKHRWELRKQQGGEIEPAEFAAPRPPEEEEEKATAGDIGDTGPEYDLGTELRLFLTVLERGCFTPEDSRGLAEMLLDLRAEGPEE